MSDNSEKEDKDAVVRRKKVIRDKVEGSETPEDAGKWLIVDAQWDENEIQSGIRRREAERQGNKAKMKDITYGVYSFVSFFIVVGVFVGWWEVNPVAVAVLSMTAIPGIPYTSYVVRLIFSWFVNLMDR